MDLGTAIRALRKTQGLTLTNLAARTGLSLNKVMLMENQLTNFELGTLLRVAHALGTSLEVCFAPLNDGAEKQAPRATRCVRKLAEAPLKKAARRMVENKVNFVELAAIVAEGLAQLGLSEMLLAMRKGAKLTQKTLAARANVAASKVCHAEHGPRNLMLGTIIRIAHALGRRVRVRLTPALALAEPNSKHNLEEITTAL
jgi:transcriptional regulator with XRE-family HTH domain